MRRLALTLLLIASLFPSRALAPLYEEDTTEKAALIDRQIRAVLKARGLDGQFGASARRVAATWFFVAPCRGKIADPIDAIQTVEIAEPGTDYGDAILEIVGLLTRDGFATPGVAACQLAETIAHAK